MSLQPAWWTQFASLPLNGLAASIAADLPAWLIGHPLHAWHQLPPARSAHPFTRGLSLHPAVDVSGGAPSRQQGHHLHQRRVASTRRCSRRSARRRVPSTWSSTSSSPAGSPTSSSPSCRESARSGVTVTIVVDAHRQPEPAGDARVRRLTQRRVPHRVTINGSAGIRSRA